jgi:hypothetical protein
MCKNDAGIEAQAWLYNIVNVCFNTDTGSVTLDTDLALYLADRPSPGEWIEQMRKEWSNRIHSGWIEQFMSALELWVVNQISRNVL